MAVGAATTQALYPAKDAWVDVLEPSYELSMLAPSSLLDRLRLALDRGLRFARRALASIALSKRTRVSDAIAAAKDLLDRAGVRAEKRTDDRASDGTARTVL
jgi:hypothetical protein